MVGGRVEPGRQIGRPGNPVAAVIVGHSVHLMKNNREVQFLNAREDRRKIRIDDVIVPFHRVRQMHGAHAGLTRDAVQFLQRQLRIANGHLDAQHKAVGMLLVHFNSHIIDDLREMRALFRRCPLPWHRAGQRQAMHQDAMLVHPLEPFFEIVVERVGIGERVSKIGERFVVWLGRPVRVAVNRDRLAHPGLSWFCVPPVHAFLFGLRGYGGGERGHHRAAGADFQKVSSTECGT